MQALKIYAAVPTLAWHERRHGELLVGTNAAPHYVESLKTLALALEEYADGPRGAVIGMSSTIAREGKSVTYDMKPRRDDPTAVGTLEMAKAINRAMGA